MKTIDDLRKEFESQVWIKAFMTGNVFSFDSGRYVTYSKDKDIIRDCDWINGCWFMYQELKQNDQT